MDLKHLTREKEKAHQGMVVGIRLSLVKGGIRRSEEQKQAKRRKKNPIALDFWVHRAFASRPSLLLFLSFVPGCRMVN